MTISTNTLGYISRAPGGAFGLPRWTLCRRDGTVAFSFEADSTREEVRRRLAAEGLVLREDDGVVAGSGATGAGEATLARLLRPARAPGRNAGRLAGSAA